MLKKSRTGYDHEELYFHELNQNLIRKMKNHDSNVISLDAVRKSKQRDSNARKNNRTNSKKAA